MRILIIGGTRFMGPRVLQNLVAAGHEVSCFHRNPAASAVPSVRHLYGDRHHLADFTDDLRSLQPDVVLDMVLITERNADELLTVFRGLPTRFVAASSCDVYAQYGRLTGIEKGEPDDGPLTETSPLRTRLYPYRSESPRPEDDPRRWADDYDKILVERALMSQDEQPVTILRLPMVFGPNDYQRRLKPYLDKMDAGESEIALSESESRFRAARGYVDNCADAITTAVLNASSQHCVYNVADEPTLDELAWVTAVGAAAGWTGAVKVVPDSTEPSEDGSDYRYHLEVDASLIRRELGYVQKVPLDEAISRTIAWERANP